jgi:DNA-binding transcriptional LysR family regulator
MAKTDLMELRHLRSFSAIAETLNFSKAAVRLHITQPALSRQMRDLEEELGQNLFDRLNNGVRLTAAGRELLVGARRVLKLSDAMLAKMRGHPAGDCPPLRIAHFGTLSAQYFSPFLRRLGRRYPQMNLQVEEYLPGETLKALRADSLDAGFTGPPEPERLRGLESRVVWIAPQELLLPAGHRLAKRRRLKISELRDEPWGIWNEKGFPGFGRSFLSACREAGFRPDVVATVEDLASLFIHIADDKFISYAPPFARTLPHAGVTFVPTDPVGAIDVYVLLAWRPDSPHAEAIRWLADTMAATIRT